MRAASLLLPFLAVVCLAAPPSDPAAYSVPLGPALDSYAYPFPVEFLPLEIEGQLVRMAFMDVRPQTARGRGTVVLLHGKNFYGSYWENTIRALASAGYRVVVPDQIGFGKSAKPEISYSFDLLATHTAHLLDHLKIEEAAVVGHSMGGMLAVRFARTYPERTSHLILENPIGLEDYRFLVPPQPTETIVQNELNMTDPARIRAFLRRYVVDWKPEVYERYVEVRARLALGGEYPRWCKASALTYQMIYQQPVRHEFGLIEPPTLLIIGQEDRTAIGRDFVAEDVAHSLGQYPRLGMQAAQDIPQGRLVELENVGHIPHLENADRFHRALLEFLAE